MWRWVVVAAAVAMALPFPPIEMQTTGWRSQRSTSLHRLIPTSPPAPLLHHTQTKPPVGQVCVMLISPPKDEKAASVVEVVVMAASCVTYA